MSGIEKPPVIDRLVSYFSPVAGARRAAARQGLSMLGQRGYDAASRRGRFEGWNPGAKSADAEMQAALPVLRARSRDLVRNNPIAAKGVQVLVDGLVGTGIRPRSASGNAVLDKQVDALWAEFCASCDIDGRTDFHGLTALAVREMVEGGDCLAIRRRLGVRATRRAGAALPLQLEIKEAEFLDETRDTGTVLKDGAKVVQGIEYDADGRRVGYWLFPEHPGGVQRLTTTQSVRLSADQVAHLYERQRTQGRGVPWATPVMRALREMDEWQEAEIVRKKTEACLVGIVLGDELDQGVNPTVADADGNMIESFRPGMLAYANGGRDIKFNQPAAVGGVYEWDAVQLHKIAAGFRVPYELLTGDLKQVNFSSSRVGMNSFRRMIEALQWQMVIPGFCNPVWRWFVEAAYDAGRLPVDRVAVEWDPPRMESVNPLQDAQADLLEVRAGFASLPQVIAKRGYDPMAVLTEQADTLKAADGLGLVLDSDPRKVAKSGAFQMEPGESAPSQD